MEILHFYEQEKYERNKPLRSDAKLKLAGDNEFLMFTSEFYVEYIRMGRMNYLTYEHALTINKKTGDFSVGYRLINKKENTYKLHQNVAKVKKNNFEMLIELTQRGYYAGEKRYNFWGVKYKRALSQFHKIIVKELGIDLTGKDYEKDQSVNPLYDMLVDYHLNKKGIKGHDNVYWHICEAYPKKKWLKLNDNKFLPAVLDQYGIKTKYMVGALSVREGKNKINLKSLRFLCSLFGENYVDYFREFEWQSICMEYIKSNKLFVCENDPEKKAITKSLKTYSEIDAYVHDGVLNTIFDLYTLKGFLKENGLEVKLKSNSSHQLITLKDTWDLHKKHFKLGYKLRYSIPQEMVDDIQADIVIDGDVFKPTIILSEDQFKLEGMIMKNCMAKQFNVGLLYIHVAMSLNKKRINLQYRRGILNQHKGKANTNVPKEFTQAIDILTSRMSKYSTISPEKEKYDIITR
jgi:hypothetical protein